MPLDTVEQSDKPNTLGETPENAGEKKSQPPQITYCIISFI